MEAWELAGTGRFTRLGTADLPNHAGELALFDSMLAVKSNREILLLDAADSSAITLMGGGASDGCLWYDLSHADGDPGRGLWIPLGIYGVLEAGLSTPSAE